MSVRQPHPSGNLYSMRHQNQVLGVECWQCRHRAVFGPRDLIDATNVGEMASCAHLLQRMRCASCGAKEPTGTLMDAEDGEGWANEKPRRSGVGE